MMRLWACGFRLKNRGYTTVRDSFDILPNAFADITTATINSGFDIVGLPLGDSRLPRWLRILNIFT